MAEFKTDKASVDAALADLVVRCKRIKRSDFEEIAHAIYVSAVKFDVDQTLLNDAWGALAPQTFAN